MIWGAALLRAGPPAELAALAALAAARALGGTGFVFDDRNGNGIREPGEPGLASVAVSNGVDIVMTDPGGAYHIPDRPGSAVFVIKPSGWQPPVDADNLPLFHAAPGAEGSVDFPFRRADEPANLRVLLLTDPQPASPAEVGYLSRGLVEGIGRGGGLAFGVTLGDVVYDRPDLFRDVDAALARIGIPWYSVPGNHDLALGTPNEDAAVAPFNPSTGRPPTRFTRAPRSSSPWMT